MPNERRYRRVAGADRVRARRAGAHGKEEKGKVGKENKKADSKKEESKEEKIARLERELDKAIKDERYEDAAKIRDELKEMN